MLCDQCKGVVHGVPWVSMRNGAYAYFCCTPCKDQFDAETFRINWTQGMLQLGRAAFNGAD